LNGLMIAVISFTPASPLSYLTPFASASDRASSYISSARPEHRLALARDGVAASMFSARWA
jgi:hypothetical protein